MLSRTTSRFPERLLVDIRRLESKYAQEVPREIVGLTLPEARERLESEVTAVVLIDLYHTIGLMAGIGHEERREVGELVVSRYQAIQVDARQYAIRCLSALAAPETREFLENVALDRTAGANERVFALAALASIGDLRSVDPVIKYLREPEFPWRDSASWSLQTLGHKALAAGRGDVFEKIRDAYAFAMQEPVSDPEVGYTLGNVMYSIGRLNIQGLTQEIIDLVESSPDAYVREDGTHALGQLGGDGQQGTAGAATRRARTASLGATHET